MERVLPHCGKLETHWHEPVNGWGVRATDDISKGEIILETPCIIFPKYMDLGKNLFEMLRQTNFLSEREKYIDNLIQNLGFYSPHKFYFKWLPKVGLDGDPLYQLCIPLHEGCIFNSRNCFNNIGWVVSEKTFIFKAEKDIKKGESVESFYGYFLGESGQIFNCVDVFNLAIEVVDGKPKIFALRFGDIAQFEASKQNLSYAKLAQLLSLAKDGLSITRLSASSPDGVERAAMDLGESLPMSFIYAKISEFKHSPLPIVKIIFKFAHKDTGQETIDEVIFRK